jgi:hypothetical protein
MAARMVTLAKPGCIVATGDVLEQAGERVAMRFSPLTGEAAERLNLDLYEVSWRDDPDAGPTEGEGGTTPMQTGVTASKRKTTVSRLRPRATLSGMPVRKVAVREVKASSESAAETPTRINAALPSGVPSAAGATSPLTPAPTPAPAPAPAVPAPPPPQPPVSTGAGPAAPAMQRANRLCLIWREKVLLVDSKTSVAMGRDETNDIVLQVSTASRRHAEVCCREGQFVLVDRSANGTFVYDEKGEEQFVHQREARLAESGAICPGCPQEEPGCEALLYWMAE